MHSLRRMWLVQGFALFVATGALVSLGLAAAARQDGKPASSNQEKAKADSTQDPATPATDSETSKEKSDKKPGGLRVPVGAPPRNKRARIADPLKNQAQGQPRAVPKDQVKAAGDNANGDVNVPRLPIWPYHYTLKIEGVEGHAVTASYYPTKEPFEAPVVLLVHESGQGRSGKDFAEPIEELKGKSFARHLQDEGFAVFVVDLRGHGGDNRRSALSADDWRLMVGDLQNAYTFLVDRHNRGEINLGKLGIVALGDGANLAAAWAASPAGGVSNEGRLSDIGALVLVSPVAEIPGLSLARVLPPIATRFPMLALSGDSDALSIQPVRDNQRVIERHRLSRVAFFDTSLHGGKLLTFFPKIATNIERFLDDPVKNRRVEWEPRFLLAPVAYEGVSLVADSGFGPFGQPENPPHANAAAQKDQPGAPPRKDQRKDAAKQK